MSDPTNSGSLGSSVDDHGKNTAAVSATEIIQCRPLPTAPVSPPRLVSPIPDSNGAGQAGYVEVDTNTEPTLYENAGIIAARKKLADVALCQVVDIVPSYPSCYQSAYQIHNAPRVECTGRP